jgi:hypothetical protein
MENHIKEDPTLVLPIAQENKKEDVEDGGNVGNGEDREDGEEKDSVTPLIPITSPGKDRFRTFRIDSQKSTRYITPSIFSETKSYEKSPEQLSNQLIINTQNLADRIQPNNKITSVLNVITKIIACTTIIAFILGVALLTTSFANPGLITIIFCGTISLAAIKAISSISISFGLLLGLRYLFLNSQETLSLTEKPQHKIMPHQTLK